MEEKRGERKTKADEKAQCNIRATISFLFTSSFFCRAILFLLERHSRKLLKLKPPFEFKKCAFRIHNAPETETW